MFVQSVFSPFSTVHSVFVCLFLLYQPHQRLFTIIYVTGIAIRVNETYGIKLQKPFSQYLVAILRDRDRF
jgi:hypothetical protein